MTISLLIAISFSIGFFIESIIGFGGGLIAYSILGFFVNLKEMVLAGLYVGSLSSLYIFYSGYQFFDKKIFLQTLFFALSGTILGVIVFSALATTTLSLIFGILLLFLSLKTLFFENFNLPKFLKNKLLLIGGISQGIFGIGGPFFVSVLKKDFKNKSALRTTMAAFFVTCNILRFFQLSLQKELKMEFFMTILWTVIPVFVAIKLGHFIHVKINEDLFKKLVSIVIFFAGLKFICVIF